MAGENLKLIGTFALEAPLSASDVPQGSLSLGEDAERALEMFQNFKCLI